APARRRSVGSSPGLGPLDQVPDDLRLPSEGPAELGNDLPEVRRRILLPGVGRVADQGDEPGELLPDQVARRGRAVEEGRVRVGARAELLDLAELALQGVPR